MLKKLIYFTFAFIFFIMFHHYNTLAINQCHFYLNNKNIATANIPFYFYENKKYDDPSSFPITKYASIETYIDTTEKCESIKKEIIISTFSSTIYDYTQDSLSSLTNKQKFDESKIKEKGELIGYSTREDRQPPTLNGYLQTYTTNINSPIDISYILSNITAQDETDGNITNKIKIEYENYTENINKIGTYIIILSVEDFLKNRTSATVHIEIKDTDQPIIKGKTNFKSYLSSPITIEEIQQELTVEDNYDINLEAYLYTCNDTYSSSKNKPGIYTLSFCVKDTSNNTSIPFITTIEVIDDIPPIIEGLNTFNSYLSSPLTVQEIMYSISAADNNKNITNSIYILEDYYTSYQNTLGEKNIYFEVADEQGNVSSPFKVVITLIDDIKPQIFGMNTFDSYLSHPLTISAIKNQLIAIDNHDNNIIEKLEIIDDTYSNNLNKTGTFNISFQVKDNSHNISEPFKITITNIDDVPPSIEGKREIEIEYKSKPTIEQLISNNLKTTDNVDEFLNIEIKSDNYTNSPNLGTFYVELYCVDSSNNISIPFTLKIIVKESILNLYTTFLYLPTSTQYTLQEINNLININTDHTLVSDDYSPSYNKEGKYLIKYELTDKTIIDINIQTYSTEIKKETTKKETFFTKLKSFFKNIFSYIKNIFNVIIPLNNHPKPF